MGPPVATYRRFRATPDPHRICLRICISDALTGGEILGGGNPEPFSTFNMEMEIMKSTPKSQKGKSNVVNMEDVKGGDDADIVT